MLWVLCAAFPVVAQRKETFPPVPQFQQGDVVNFIGDSITHGGRWHTYIQDVYRTRFPEREIRWANTGVSGDVVGQALARFDADILPVHASVAVVMLGMNDVGSSLYGPAPSADVLSKRELLVKTYLSGMRQLVQRLQTAGVPTIILVTPSPYDDTAILPAPNNVGRNEVLGMCAAGLASLAAEMKVFLVDFHGPMTAMNRARQASDPNSTLIGADRVHPTSPGSLVMANLFLQAQQVTTSVASIEVHAQDIVGGLRCEACSLRAVAKTRKGVSFYVQELRMPTPVDPQAESALSLLTDREFPGKEMLQVSGLPTGVYELLIDGERVQDFSAEELSAGVNLAALRNTPEVLQAEQVEALDEKVREQRVTLRDLALIRYTVLAPAKVDYHDTKATAEFLFAYLDPSAKNSAHASSAFLKGVAARYEAGAAGEAATEAQIDAELLELKRLSVVKSHHFELRKK